MSSSLTFEETPETNRGRLLYELLVSVHAHIRGERDRVERLAAAVVDGLPAEGLEQELEALRSNSMLWQFQLGCLRYCRFVHLHHRAEDADLFGELEEVNPAIAPAVERLRAEHREVSDYLDAVEASARALTEDDSLEARRSVADALEALAGHLLAHLEYEERSVAATARRLPDLTFSNQLREVADGDLPLRRTSNEHHPRT
jgi:Hemerythrin HHE cation binding domain